MRKHIILNKKFIFNVNERRNLKIKDHSQSNSLNNKYIMYYIIYIYIYDKKKRKNFTFHRRRSILKRIVLSDPYLSSLTFTNVIAIKDSKDQKYYEVRDF